MKWVDFCCCLLMAIAGLCVCLSSRSLGADNEIVEVLLDIQETQKASLSSGTMHVECEIKRFRQLPGRGVSAELDLHLRSSLDVMWDPRIHVYRETAQEVAPALKLDSTREAVIIQLGGEQYSRGADGTRGARNLHVSAYQAQLQDCVLDQLHVCPDQLWFRSLLPGKEVSAFISPSSGSSRESKPVIATKGDLISVEREIGGRNGVSGAKVWVVCDMKQGGNVVEHGVDSPGGFGVRVKKMTWKEVENNHWSLSEYVEEFRKTRGGKPWHKATLEVTEFSRVTDTELLKSMTRDSILADHGLTRITEQLNGRLRVRTPGHSSVSEQELRNAAREAVKSGFGAKEQ